LAELLQERSSPELVYLETKFAALVSYGLTVELLKEVLPISQELSTTAIRQRVRQTAQRLEDELGKEQDMFISLVAATVAATKTGIGFRIRLHR
jgi:hypothetical protein